MYLSKLQLFSLLLLTHILLPIVLCISLLFLGEQPVIVQGVYILLVGIIIELFYKAGAWEFTFYSYRYIILGVYALIAVGRLGDILYHVATHGAYLELNDTSVLLVVIGVIGVVLLGNEARKVYRASQCPKNFILLDLPVRKGKYIITDGGEGAETNWLNYHYKAKVHKGKNEAAMQTNETMHYAVDIVELNKLGRTTTCVLTATLTDYEFFGKEIVAPCKGQVVEVVEGIENNEVFVGAFPYNIGNHVILKTGEYYVLIGHMQKGSVAVNEGEWVEVGQTLGKVGNSGLSARPHIHMHAFTLQEEGNYWNGTGVPILFKNEKGIAINPVKNQVYTKRVDFTGAAS